MLSEVSVSMGLGPNNGAVSVVGETVFIHDNFSFLSGAKPFFLMRLP
jgi:hypothetical protein